MSHADRAARTKAATAAASLIPGCDSTPLAISTAPAPVARIASATLSAFSPPASTSGGVLNSSWNCRARVQSASLPLPPKLPNANESKRINRGRQPSVRQAPRYISNHQQPFGVGGAKSLHYRPAAQGCQQLGRLVAVKLDEIKAQGIAGSADLARRGVYEQPHLDHCRRQRGDDRPSAIAVDRPRARRIEIQPDGVGAASATARASSGRVMPQILMVNMGATTSACGLGQCFAAAPGRRSARGSSRPE